MKNNAEGDPLAPLPPRSGERTRGFLIKLLSANWTALLLRIAGKRSIGRQAGNLCRMRIALWNSTSGRRMVRRMDPSRDRIGRNLGSVTPGEALALRFVRPGSGGPH